MRVQGSTLFAAGGSKASYDAKLTPMYLQQNSIGNFIYLKQGNAQSISEAYKALNRIAFSGQADTNVYSDLHTKAAEISNEILNGASKVERLSKKELLAESLHKGESVLTVDGAMSIMTGKYTGRTPEAKFFVSTPSVENKIDWSTANMGISEENSERIYKEVQNYLKDKKLYIYDGQAGADTDSSIPVRFINTSPAQSFFVQNMFAAPNSEQKSNFTPKFTVIAAPDLKLDPEKHGVKCEAGVIIDIDKGLIMITGTKYSGEIKKSVFSAMNYLAPQKGILPMHCSANVGGDGDVALFFGLSGTGKTTLSADPNRGLIGDDEHFWSDKGISNLEGGCYAKVIDLSQENEPDIWKAVNSEGAMLENVPVDKDGKPYFSLDLNNPEFVESLKDPSFVKMLNLPEEYAQKLSGSGFNEAIRDEKFVEALNNVKVENTRGSYPMEYVSNAMIPGKIDAHPKNIVFLTYDASGVMPPVAKLTPEQAKYYFMSGYTSKVAGTERGVKEPQATFSTCFGAPFMPLHPVEYAKMLESKIEENDSDVYIINTGLVGGAYGTGNRISIKDTRSVVNAVLSGQLKDVEFEKDSIFGFKIPKTCPGVNSNILNPKEAWDDKEAYDATARKLASDFIKNFKKYETNDEAKELAQFGPSV